MGDDVHVRTQAATNLLLRSLLPAPRGRRPPAPGRGGEVPVGQPSALPQPRHGCRPRPDHLGRPGREQLGRARDGPQRHRLRRAGWAEPARTWHLAPSPMVGRALYQPGRHASSTPHPTSATAPCSSSWASAGPPRQAPLRSPRSWAAPWPTRPQLTEDLAPVCVGSSSRFTIPVWGMKGSPRRGRRAQGRRARHHPQVTTGILHNADGSGQIGAGSPTPRSRSFICGRCWSSDRTASRTRPPGPP